MFLAACSNADDDDFQVVCEQCAYGGGTAEVYDSYWGATCGSMYWSVC
jgi:hypothetical protein